MSQGHGERLTAVDTAFLSMENRNLHMHVGGLFIFEPPEGGAFDFARFARLVRSRLHLVPRYRQRLAYPPLGMGNPVWVDDPDFDLSYHLRHAALPRPGTPEQLNEYAARILSRQLDRERPLWELYYIEGLEDGRFALLAKSHHAMIDGIAGMDIATVMLDLSPDGSEELPPPEPWEAAPTPTGLRLATDTVKHLAASPAAVLESGRRAAHAPRSPPPSALRVGRGVASIARTNLAHPPPRSLLNQAPGPHRRLATHRLPLEDVKHVKNVFRTTVNDVVLAMVADATGRYLRDQGARTDGLWLRAMVPVSTRESSGEHVLGNQVVAVFVDLPMFEMDPVERLHVCHEAMAEVKSSHHAVGAGFLIDLAGFAPPTLHAMGARLGARSRLFNFLVTNVPGPQVPIYCLGARLLGAFPFTPLAATHSYAVGLTSIDGWLNFGITADYDALPDVEQVGELLGSALEELSAHAEAAEQRAQRLRDEAAPGGGRAADA
jgi:diacylglycerol O-acyltransferase / wax synthase